MHSELWQWFPFPSSHSTLFEQFICFILGVEERVSCRLFFCSHSNNIWVFFFFFSFPTLSGCLRKNKSWKRGAKRFHGSKWKHVKNNAFKIQISMTFPTHFSIIYILEMSELKSPGKVKLYFVALTTWHLKAIWNKKQKKWDKTAEICPENVLICSFECWLCLNSFLCNHEWFSVFSSK